MVVRVLIAANKLVALTELTGNVRAIFDPACLGTNPTMLESRRCRGRIQSRRGCPGLASRIFRASFALA
jgi:hypothetical protein